jgi:Predicted metal-dependent hydrolase
VVAFPRRLYRRYRRPRKAANGIHRFTVSAIFDITLPIRTGQLSWPGDPPVAVTPWFRLAAGDPAEVSEVRLSSHTGTHVDPPSHFIEGGATVDQLPLDALVGPARVVDLTGRPGPIGPATSTAWTCRRAPSGC